MELAWRNLFWRNNNGWESPAVRDTRINRLWSALNTFLNHPHTVTSKAAFSTTKFRGTHDRIHFNYFVFTKPFDRSIPDLCKVSQHGSSWANVTKSVLAVMYKNILLLGEHFLVDALHCHYWFTIQICILTSELDFSCHTFPTEYWVCRLASGFLALSELPPYVFLMYFIGRILVVTSLMRCVFFNLVCRWVSSKLLDQI